VVVLIVTACPVGLRGHLTRWLLEISPGVFVGHLSHRVRQEMWDRVLELCKDGRALMVFSVRGEQRLEFWTHRHDWVPEDVDGLTLIRRPHTAVESGLGGRHGWSKASRYRRLRRPTASEAD
jgi:CRISPR-associated protein Cas2